MAVERAPALSFPRGRATDADGNLTREHSNVLERQIYEMQKIIDAASAYQALNTATATTADIAAALNAFMAAIQET